MEALRTAYVNERCAPSLLPHQDELINEIKELINEQAKSRPRCRRRRRRRRRQRHAPPSAWCASGL